MESRNGQSRDVLEFSDVSGDHDADSGSAETKRGPWTHSADSYSTKRHGPLDTAPIVPKKTHCILGAACVVVFIVGLALGIIIGTFAIRSDKDESSQRSSTERIVFQTTTAHTPTPAPSPPPTPTECVCTTPPPPTTTPGPTCDPCGTRQPDESNGEEALTSPFAALTREELDKAISAVVNQGLASYGTSLKDNRISHVYLYPSEKAKALQYLDTGGEFPGRYAKVHVFRGASDPPDVMEYKVGPLHLNGDSLTIENITNDGDISFNRRPYDGTEQAVLRQIVNPHLLALRRMLEESFDGKYYRSGISVSFAFMPAFHESDRVSKAFLYLTMGGYLTIRILPVTMKISHPGIDTSQWTVSDFYYLSQGPYDSGTALQDAYDAGTLRKVVYPSSYFTEHNAEFDLKMNKSETPRPLSDLPPPQSYEPQGPRYTIRGSRIAWMGWSLDFTSDPIRGPAVYDVRFHDNRVAYEISLQDVTLLYASQSNGAGPPVISDTIFFLGNANPPKLGLDCPTRASLVHLTMYVYGSITNKAYACVFEADGQEAAWKFQSLGISTNYLVVRAPMNLGNYEYSVEWRLHLDGHVETFISASGFLYGAFWDEGDPLVDSDKSSTPFGFRLAEYTLGPIHDHAYAFKVDMDVLGVNNSLEILHWKTGDVLDALKSQTNASEVPGYFPFNNTRYIEYELLDREGSFVLDPVRPKYFTIVNENEKNLWGVKRGYRIIPHSQGAENFGDHVMFGPWGHLKFNVAVTRRKDSELYATNSLYDLFQPLRAFRGVAGMLDDEPARDSDLVVWVTEKFFHAPSAEDLPMTLKVKRGFTLQPYNYFDRTPTFDIRGFYSNSPDDRYTVNPCFVSGTR